MQQRLCLAKELTFDTVQAELKRLIISLKDERISDVQLDLQDVKHCDSAGLALLIEAKRLFQTRNKQLKIEKAPEAIRSLAEFYGVEVVLND